MDDLAYDVHLHGAAAEPVGAHRARMHPNGALDVVLDVLLHDDRFGAPRLVADVERLELSHEDVDDVVLLEPFEDDVLRLGMRLQLRVEDLFLDGLVDHQLALDRREQLGPCLDAPFGRALELGQELLELVVVVLEQRDRVHGSPRMGPSRESHYAQE